MLFRYVKTMAKLVDPDGFIFINYKYTVYGWDAWSINYILDGREHKTINIQSEGKSDILVAVL